jgi:hypothetical protein
MAESKSAALPLGDAPMPLFQAVAYGGWTIMRGAAGRNCSCPTILRKGLGALQGKPDGGQDQSAVGLPK